MTFESTTDPTSEYWERCARHANRQTTRNIGHLYLCDPCAERLTSDCFNDRPPLYHGDSFDGWCQLCNERTAIRLRQWFICQVCLNVVHNYPKGIAASTLVHRLWHDTIEPSAPEFRLKETDVLRIEPYVRTRFSAATKAASLDALDFLVSRVDGATEAPVFHIEEKTGGGAIDDFREFQLDINDCDDITTVCRRTGLPAYLFHVQVVQQYHAPSRISKAIGMWWTDIYSLRNAFIRTARRRDEPKPAAYFRTDCFRPMDEFPAQLMEERYRGLTQRIVTEGCPDLFERDVEG